MPELRRDNPPQGSEIRARDWKRLNPAEEATDYEPVSRPCSFILFKFRSTTSLQLFLTYFNASLLYNIWEAGLREVPSRWSYKNDTRSIAANQFDLKLLYHFLAIKVYIQGAQVPISEAQPGSGRNLRDAVVESNNFFSSVYPESRPICTDIIEHLLAHFLITGNHVAELCVNFRSIVKEVGEAVVGDEKLFHFTGKSGNLRLMIKKPARIGLWFYELVGAIDESKSYLLDVKLFKIEKELGEHEHVADIVSVGIYGNLG